MPSASGVSATEGRGYARYVLGVLGVVNILAYYDRNLISILVQPIEQDLHLNDAQMGLLSGIAFAVAYSIFAIPIARIADRHGRVRVLTAAVGMWSVMTLLTAQAVGFTTMAFARIGVALGEAGGYAPAQALVADHFLPESRGTALAVLGTCGGLGISLALAGGGLLNDWLGWRAAYLLSGVPGLLLAALLWWTVREAKPTTIAASHSVAPDDMSLMSALRLLTSRPTYVHLCIGLGILTIGAYAQFVWTPTFMMRAYDFSAGKVGSYYSAATGPATLVSVFLGGVLNDWLLRRRYPAAPLWILAASFGLCVPLYLMLYLVHDFWIAIALSAFTNVLGGLWVAPSYALVQSLAGPRLRALGAALYAGILNVIGLSLGPYLAGFLSDRLAPLFGARSLAISLCVLTVASTIGLIPLLLAIRTIETDVARAEGRAVERS